MTRLEDFINRPVPFLGRPMLALKRAARSSKSAQIRPGGVYRRDVKRNWVEIAEVLRIATDAQGIEHVTYDLTIQRNKGSGHPTPERRMLNMRSFRELFREPIQA